MYENLALLLGAYLHQDFDLDHGTADDAVRAFAAGEPERAEATSAEIGDLLGVGSDDADVAALLARLGSCYRPEGDGRTPRSWLAHVRDLLAVEARNLAVVVGGHELDRTSGGMVTGPIWIRAEGADFPCAGWSDFPVALIGAWLTVLAEPGTAELRFMEGPYVLRVERGAPGRSLLTAEADGAAEPTLVTEADTAAVVRAVHRAGVVLLTACRARGWDHRDLRYLAGRLDA